jgi:hypothetical protein
MIAMEEQHWAMISRRSTKDVKLLRGQTFSYSFFFCHSASSSIAFRMVFAN